MFEVYYEEGWWVCEEVKVDEFLKIFCFVNILDSLGELIIYVF